MILQCIVCVETFFIGISTLSAFIVGIKFYWKKIKNFFKKPG